MSEEQPGRREFDANRDEVNRRFDELTSHLVRIEGRLIASMDHTHRDKVGWVALVPLLGALTFGLIQVLA